MKCSICGKTARRYTVKNAKGECVVELCSECYNRLYGGDGETVEEEKGGQKECPACGTTYDDFKRTYLLGCAECYDTFREELIPVLGYMQRGVYHTGSAPVGVGEAEYDRVRSLVVEKERLREELETLGEGNAVRKREILGKLERIRRELQRREED